MFKHSNSLISATNSAILASENFLIPLSLRCTGRTAAAAFDSLHRGFHDVKSFLSVLVSIVPNISLVGFDAPISPRNSRILLEVSGKDHIFTLKFVLRCPIPTSSDFWQRVQFMSNAYEKLAELSAVFHERKDMELFLEESLLDQQKEDPQKLRAFDV